MRIIKSRGGYNRSNDRLRRARRLYGRMVARSILNGDIEPLELAKKAQDRGLYSQKTMISDIAFSLVRYSYKFNDEGLGWYQFCNKFGLWMSWKC